MVILIDIEMVEGQDCLLELDIPEFDEARKFFGLLLHFTKSLHNSACFVVLDSGFCIGCTCSSKKGWCIC